MRHNDIALVITAYCEGTGADTKKHMAKTLCKYLHEKFYTVMVTHSPLDVETQKYCDLVVYDADNSFQKNGIPERTNNHGFAELTSLHNAVNILNNKFNYIFKLCYDSKPDIDYEDIVDDCKALNKKLVTGNWGTPNSFGTFMFFSEVEFFKKTLSMDEIHRLDKDLEYAWYDSIRDKGLLHEVGLFGKHSSVFGKHEMIQYAHAGGTTVDNYPFK